MENDQVFDHEDRFRVDRRKLENLILGRFEPIKDTAGDFFLRVTIFFTLVSKLQLKNEGKSYC